MDDKHPKALMLFDGDCGICTSFATFAAKVDLKKQFEIIPYQTYSEEKLKSWGMSYKQCSEKMQVVTPQGRTYGGAFGMNYFLLPLSPVDIPRDFVLCHPTFLARGNYCVCIRGEEPAALVAMVWVKGLLRS